MKFADLLDLVGDSPIFSSALLRVGEVDAVDVASQLSRWVASGKLVSLRRGVYALAPTYASRRPHPFEIANLLARPSYVSTESALSYHGMLPEAVFTTTSVTSARGGEFSTPLGEYSFRHIAPSLFWGYRLESLGDGRAQAFVASPEKALLDLVYLVPGGDGPAYLRQLRLDRMEAIDAETLHAFAEKSGKPKLMRAVSVVERIMRAQADEWRDV